MLVPIAVGVLTTAAYLAKLRRDNKTPSPEQAAERAVIYDTAINTVKDPDQLRKLAGAFQEAGLTAEATMLSLRADNAEASPEVKAARKEAFRKGMASTNVPGIRALANAFELGGAPGAAKALREHANEVESAPPASSIETEPPQSQPESEEPTAHEHSQKQTEA